MKYFLKRIGKLFLGLAIMLIAFFPMMISASFFLIAERDFGKWVNQFTNSEGLMTAMIVVVALVFLGIIVYGFYLTVTAAQTSCEELDKQILDAMKKHVEERQEQCPHDFVHQVGFTNMLKCDECGATFENKHFVSE